MTNKEIYIIVAVDSKNGIGKDNKMPWHFKKETQYFKEITTTVKDPSKKNMVIMGKNTWYSLPEKYRPLKDRKNVVLTRDETLKIEGVEIYTSLNDAIVSAGDDIEKVFIIGGATLFKESLTHPNLTGLYITFIEKEYECDTYFPEIPAKFSTKQLLKEDEEDGTKLKFMLFR
ncbi:MAG: dihydrofolate reductase [Candidatus Gracilibacteria bacterium]|jgi:dihydrofolate reductase